MRLGTRLTLDIGTIVLDWSSCFPVLVAVNIAFVILMSVGRNSTLRAAVIRPVFARRGEEVGDPLLIRRRRSDVARDRPSQR